MPSKKSKLRFYADECFPVPVVTTLRSQGYSIIHAYDQNFVQKMDSFHLATSKKLGRVLITLDRDFLYYIQVSLNEHPGVIVISAGSSIPASVLKICTKRLNEISEDFIKNSLVNITIDKITKIKNSKIVSEKVFHDVN